VCRTTLTGNPRVSANHDNALIRVSVLDINKQGHLVTARYAPRRPEIQHDDTPALLVEDLRGAAQIRQRKFCRLLGAPESCE
jgi:hypothetical protein